MTPDPVSNYMPNKVKKLLDEGLWAEAVMALDQALQTSPRQMSLWRGKANTLVALGQSEEALNCYERMLEIDPRDPSIYAEKAALLETLDRDDEALECYDRALALAASDVTYLDAKARLLTRLERFPEAIAVYDALLKLEPEKPGFLVAKGDALLTAGQIEQAAVYFEQAAGRNPSSFGAAEWTRRGDTLFRKGRDEEALKFYDKGIQTDANYSWAYGGKALALAETPEKAGEADWCMNHAIELDPKIATLRVDKGNLHYRRKEYKAAVECYAKATELDPKSQVAWGNLDLAQEALGDFEQAVVSAEKRLALDPTSADGWVNRGVCLDHLKRLEESTASYQRALELDSENFWATNNMGWNLTQMQNIDEALAYYDKAIRIDPREDVPWLNKARNLRQRGRYQEALDTLDKALKAVSNKRDVLAGMGYIYTEFLFRHDKALEYYQQSLQLDPTDVTGSINVADCLIKMGKYALGRAEAEKLVGRLGDPELECGLSTIILASYALEGDVAGRARQFEIVLEHLKTCCPEGKPRNQTPWGFGGLLDTILSGNMSSESKFLISTAVDMQEGRIELSKLTFFKPAKTQAVEAASEGSATPVAGTARQATAFS